MAKKKHEAPAPARRWIKLYCAETLRGSINVESLDTQCVWFKLLLMAGDSRIDGVICYNIGIPIPHKRIADTLGIRLPQLELCLRKFKEQERISEDGNGIHITKWELFQAPYQMRMLKEKDEAETEQQAELTHKQLGKQAELDASAIADCKHSDPQNLHNLCNELGPERVLAAQKWKEAHRR